jgi:hypothetical protein
MKSLFTFFLILFSQISFAYDPSLMINVQKVSAMLNRAEHRGVTSSGTTCYVELRRIEDGYYTLYTASENDQLFIGLDIEAYGKIHSSWTKRSFHLTQIGKEGSQELRMKEDFSTKRLSVFSDVSENGKSSDMQCYLPLKKF